MPKILDKVVFLSSGGELLENIMAFAEEYLIGRLKSDCSDYMKKTLASNSDVTTKEVLRFHLLARRFVLADVEEITTKILQSTHTSKLEACENFTKIGLEEVFYNRVKNAEDVIRGSRKVIEDFGKALRRQVDDTTCYTHNDMCDPTCRRCIDSCISFRCTLSKTLNKHGGDSVSNRPINRILEKSEQFVLWSFSAVAISRQLWWICSISNLVVVGIRLDQMILSIAKWATVYRFPSKSVKVSTSCSQVDPNIQFYLGTRTAETIRCDHLFENRLMTNIAE